jgi:hypothetical protein
MSEWIIGQKFESKVSDWRKLIADFTGQFPYRPLAALIVETFANPLSCLVSVSSPANPRTARAFTHI